MACPPIGDLGVREGLCQEGSHRPETPGSLGTSLPDTLKPIRERTRRASEGSRSTTRRRYRSRRSPNPLGHWADEFSPRTRESGPAGSSRRSQPLKRRQHSPSPPTGHSQRYGNTAGSTGSVNQAVHAQDQPPFSTLLDGGSETSGVGYQRTRHLPPPVHEPQC